MGGHTSKCNLPLLVKFKTEKDLPRKARKVMSKLLKTNPHLKHVPNKSLTEMSPREWMLTKVGFFYVEPYLTNLYEWTDGQIPLEVTFDRHLLQIARKYLIDNLAVSNSDWVTDYMREVFIAWELMGEQWPANIAKKERKVKKKLRKFTNFAMEQNSFPN